MKKVQVSADVLSRKNVLFRSNGPFFLSSDEVLHDGTVLTADDKTRYALICYLSGARSYTDQVSYDKLVAIADETAPHMEIENYSGHFIDLR